MTRFATGKAIQCYGKKYYGTYWQANRGSKNLGRNRSGAKPNIYKCNYCGGWHVGNSLHTTKRMNRHSFNQEGMKNARITISE